MSTDQFELSTSEIAVTADFIEHSDTDSFSMLKQGASSGPRGSVDLSFMDFVLKDVGELPMELTSGDVMPSLQHQPNTDAFTINNVPSSSSQSFSQLQTQSQSMSYPYPTNTTTTSSTIQEDPLMMSKIFDLNFASSNTHSAPNQSSNMWSTEQFNYQNISNDPSNLMSASTASTSSMSEPSISNPMENTLGISATTPCSIPTPTPTSNSFRASEASSSNGRVNTPSNLTGSDRLALEMAQSEARKSSRRRRKRRSQEATARTQGLEESLARLQMEKKELQNRLEISKSLLKPHISDKLANVFEEPEEIAEKLYNDRVKAIQEAIDFVNSSGFDDLRPLIEKMLDKDLLFVHPDSTDELVGLDEFEKFLKSLFGAFPDATITLLSFHKEDPQGQKIKVRFEFRGTHLDVFAGIPPLKNQLTVHGHAFVTFKDTTLTISQMVWSWNASLTILAMLGLKPAVVPE